MARDVGRLSPIRPVAAAIISVLLATSPGIAALKAAGGPVPKIDRLDVRLLYQTTGALSDDIAPPAKFSGWNTIVGEGDAKEPATDVLVRVHLSVPGDEANVDLPLRLRAVDSKGKVLASRTLTALFFRKGRSVQALFVPNATCAVALKVEASIGRESKVAAVKLDCGE